MLNIQGKSKHNPHEIPKDFMLLKRKKDFWSIQWENSLYLVIIYLTNKPFYSVIRLPYFEWVKFVGWMGEAGKDGKIIEVSSISPEGIRYVKNMEERLQQISDPEIREEAEKVFKRTDKIFRDPNMDRVMVEFGSCTFSFPRQMFEEFLTDVLDAHQALNEILKK